MPVTVAVHVAAPPDAVYARLADLERWPDWNPACAAATPDGPVVPGTRVRMQLRHPRGRLFWTEPTLTAVEAGARLAWVTRALGFRAPTEVTLAASGGGTDVTLRSWSAGPLAFSYRLMFPEKTQGLLWSGALTGLARAFR